MKLVNSEIDDIVGDRMVTFIIPKNMMLDKKTVLDYTNNLYRDYENLNYIDANNEANVNVKMYRTLGISIGIMIAIFFI